MRQFFVFPLVIFIVLWGQFLFSFHTTSSISLSQKESQIQQIETQIQELEEIKRGYESKVAIHEDQASRLQFDDQTYLETRRQNQLAEENRAKATAIQKEIDRLKAERAKLLK